MYPTYRYMDAYPHGPHPYPHQRDSMPPPYYQYPSWESIPRVESPKPPAAWGPGSYHANASHHHPAECSGCCMHSYPHGHSSFRAPYPQPQPFPQSYYGPYGYHEPYPYFVPPAPYAVDQARYDYDKSRSHCCSCPSHGHMVGNGGVRVEEHNPEGEQQDDKVSRIIRMPGNASPMVWFPSGSLKGMEEDKKPDPQSAVWFPNNPSQVMWIPSNFMDEEENKKSEAQPPASNEWIPLDVRSLKDLMRAANEKKKLSADEDKNKLDIGNLKDLLKAANEKRHSNADEDKNKFNIADLKELLRAANEKKHPSAEENIKKLDMGSLNELIKAANEKQNLSADGNRSKLPWPLIWVPGDGDTEGTKAAMENPSPKDAEEVRPKLKIIPMKLLDERGEKPEMEEHKSHGSQERANERETKIKTIPVKQIEDKPSEDGKHTEKANEKQACVPESNQKTADSKQNGHAKTSKLPPVCLRVDPLPKKKNGNGKSRSPSPPSHKVETQQSLRENKDDTCAKEIQVVDTNAKSSHDVEKKNQRSENDTVDTPAKVDSQEESKKIDAKAVENKKDETKVEAERTEERDLNENQTSEKRSRVLSPNDAAMTIQSAYRGYEVRRWRPLEKLRKIAEIQEKADAITKELQGLEELPNGPDKKQVAVMNENIMHLLLQLDTIQGLQQNVREARKHIARELVCLQEKLDAIGRQASKEPEKTQPAISEAPVSDIASSPTIVSEDSPKTVEQGPDSPEMEQKIVDSTLEGNAASKEQAEITIHQVPGLGEEDSALLVTKETAATSTLATEVVHLENDCKVSSSPDQNDASSVEAKPADSDLSKAEELAVKEAHSLVAEKQSDSAGPDVALEEQASDQSELSGAPEQAVDVEEVPSSAKNELSRAPEQVVHVDEGLSSDQNELSRVQEQVFCVQEAPSENVGNIVEGDHQEIQDSSFQPDQASTELLGADAGLVMLSEPTSQDAAALPVAEPEVVSVIEPDFDASGSKLGESLTAVSEAASADAELVHSAVEKPEPVEVFTLPPDNQLGNGECLLKEKEGLEVNEFDEVIRDDVIVPEVEDTAMLDKLQNADDHVMEAGSDAEIIKSPLQETLVGSDAVVTKEEPKNQHDADGILKEELAAHANSEGFTSPYTAEDVTMTESNDQTRALSKEEIKNADRNEQAIGPSKEELKLVEENEKLREMLERLLEAGKTQLGVIADLNGRVKDLEKKLSQKKRQRSKRQKFARSTACKVAS